MSIINSYEPDGEALIKRSDVYDRQDRVIDSCIIIFSYKILEALIQDKLVDLVDDKAMRSISENYALYVYKDTNIGVIKTSVGAPITATIIEEISHKFSCKKFVMFGTCGGLDKNIAPNMIIVPNEAYRDEGMSYHYAPYSDYIKIKNYQVITQILDQLKVEYVVGKTWTTDAFYRETKKQMELRRAEGCIAVEMEISGCQAVSDFYHYDFYPFLYRADNLDSQKWDKGISKDMPKDERLRIFSIALFIAKMI